MNDIPPINSAGQVSPVSTPRTAARHNTPQGQPDDRLEISEAGQMLSSLDNDSPIRAEKVAQIRQAIADGTYETREKLELTVDRLLEVLRATPAGT